MSDIIIGEPSRQPFLGLFPILPQGARAWTWVTAGDLWWELGQPGSQFWICCPAGTITDLASIPRWLHWLINPYDPQTARAAVKHDELLRQGYEQRVAAGEWYRALIEDGVPVWKARAFYFAVAAATDNWENRLPLSHG